MASALKRLLVQTSHYSFSSLLTMLAGLVSFPVLTHVLPIADYGVLSLISATVTVCVALGKTGLQHSIIRFQSEVAEGKSAYTRAQLYSTTVFGMTGASLVVTVLLLVGILVLPARWFGGAQYTGPFMLGSGLIIIQVMDSALTNFLRAEQQTVALMKYTIIKKYFGLGLIMLAVLVVWRGSLKGFYVASLLSEGLMVVALAWVFFTRAERGAPALSQFSTPLYRTLVHFGIPMLIGYELSGIVLMVGDRYVIQGMLGEEQVGLYSAAYNLCMYVQAVVIASVSQAIMPLYMQMWAQKGVDETSAFIAKSLRTYVLIGAPVVAGIAAVGPALLTSLASDKYKPAGPLLPWIIAGMVVDGMNSMVGAGLFIHRKTRVIMVIVICCALLNVGLNLTLIPVMGIMGSAIATLASYSAVVLALGFAGRRLLPVPLPWGTLVRSGAAATIMYFALQRVLPDRGLLTVGVRICLGVLVYGLVMLVIDQDARALARKALGRFRRVGGGGGAS